jgi:putative flavoprotein involved in K+ transport
MPAIIAELQSHVQAWLDRWNGALAASDAQALAGLLCPDSHWRDALALTWRIGTLSGRAEIVRELHAKSRAAECGGWVAHPRFPAIALANLGEEETIRCALRFESKTGPCDAFVRLKRDPAEGGALKVWTVMTALVDIRGHEEKYKSRRDERASVNRSFQGPNWKDRRAARARYEGRDPAVLVIGGGQAGLTIAANLTQRRIDTLVVEANARLGDNWRKRYKALVLHNQIFNNHMPYMPFPETWPVFIPRDMLADWLEYYAEAMELNVWPGTVFEQAHYDAPARRWTVTLRRAGKTVTLHPRHIVMATGVSAVPDRSPIAGVEAFAGAVMHTDDYESAEPWRGRRVIVFGAGTSAHDVAQDLCENGAQVTMVQRGPTLVQNVTPTAQLPYALYEGDYPVEYCDLAGLGTPWALYKIANRLDNERARELDHDLQEGLIAAGFNLNRGEDGIGWQMMYLTRGGGYYYNVGCSDLIIEGRIRVVQGADVAGFEAGGLRLRDGELLEAGLVISGKGYLGPSAMVEKLFGAEAARKVGPVWGIDPASQELRNMWTPTAQPGLWIHAGSLAQCRIYSRLLALQIQARELGLPVND